MLVNTTCNHKPEENVQQPRGNERNSEEQWVASGMGSVRGFERIRKLGGIDIEQSEWRLKGREGLLTNARE
jgi:hypothetical protein